MVVKVRLLGSATAFVALMGILLCSMDVLRVKVQSKKPGGEQIGLIVPAVLLPASAMLIPGTKIRAVSIQLHDRPPPRHCRL